MGELVGKSGLVGIVCGCMISWSIDSAVSFLPSLLNWISSPQSEKSIRSDWALINILFPWNIRRDLPLVWLSWGVSDLLT